MLSSNLDEEPMRGFELLRQLRAADPGVLAIMLLDSSKRETVLHAFRAGARGILARRPGNSFEVHPQRARGTDLGEQRTDDLCGRGPGNFSDSARSGCEWSSLLSKREMEVVRSLAEGLTNREIAERLGLSQHTIKNYLFRVYDKLGVSSRLELLFMTLTQAGAPRLKEQMNPAASLRKGSANPARSASAEKTPHSPEPKNLDEAGLRAPALMRREPKSETHDEADPSTATASPFGPDPLG